MDKIICIKEFKYFHFSSKINELFYTSHDKNKLINNFHYHIFHINEEINLFKPKFILFYTEFNKYFMYINEYRELQLNKILNG